MPPPSVSVLEQTNAYYKTMEDRWARYRAFTGDLESSEQKAIYLPKGAREFDDDCLTRRRLTHNVGWSEWAVDRMSGVLTKTPANITWPEKSKVSVDVQERVKAFMSNADGCGRSLAAYWTDLEPEVLTMGAAFLEVIKETPTSTPYLSTWKVEEVLDWKVDERGDLEWVALYREVAERATWDAAEEQIRVWRVLTRTEGMEFRAKVIGSDGKKVERADEVEGSPWTHNIGIVPLVPAYARRGKVPMVGRSYIDAISRADLRNLQLDSDQSYASYLHGSPVMKVWTAQQLSAVGIGTSQALKLKPGGDGLPKEDAEYLTVDPAGMEVREKIIDRTTRQAFTVAGIDPQTVAGPSGTRGPRSGSSIAWGFSTGEAPTLTALSEEMDSADKKFIELVTRYETSGSVLSPSEQASDAGVVRPKEWDMMAAQETVDLGTDVLDLTPSPKHKKAILKAIAAKVPGNIPQQLLVEVNTEIDATKDEDLPMGSMKLNQVGMNPVDIGGENESEDENGDVNGEPMMSQDEMRTAMSRS